MGKGRESGQALVETAIVMPLFVFTLLGLLQVGLMHQVRSLTKYAAYKATRAGTIYHANMRVMENAALAILAPVATQNASGSFRGYAKNRNTSTADAYLNRMQEDDMRRNRIDGSTDIHVVEVTICSPTKDNQALSGNNGVSFDDPKTTWNDDSSDWKKFQNTKLTAQVTFNYRMPIPFASMLLYAIARGQQKADLMWVTRLGDQGGSGQGGREDRAGSVKTFENKYQREAQKRARFDAFAQAGQGYILQIRANYSLRMMSDLYPTQPGFEIPQTNECAVNFPREGGP